jgi:hypothetical protein
VENLVEVCKDRLIKGGSEAAVIVLMDCLLQWALVIPRPEKELFSSIFGLLDLAYKYAPVEVRSHSHFL